MRIGYIIAAHTLPEQLVRLVRRLQTERARFYLHVDARAPASVMAVVTRELGDDPQVRLLPRHPCQWAAYSQVEAALEGVRAVVADPERLDYGVLLTGQDYPLQSPTVVERTLAHAGGRSFMSHWPSEGRFRDRVERWHWHGQVLGRRVRVPNRFVPLTVRRRPPQGLRLFTGSAYWCLSRACLEHVLAYVDERPDVPGFFRHASSPDESFFQSILMSSPLAPTIVDDDLRYIDWSDGGPSPRTLTMRDRDALLAAGDLFARKFDPRVDPEILELLDARIDAQDAEVTAPGP